MAATNNTKSVDRHAIVGETTKLMFESDTLEDPRTRVRTVPFEVICPGMPRTGTSCKLSHRRPYKQASRPTSLPATFQD